MTTFIAHNSVTRRYLKRGELMAKRRSEASPDTSQESSRKTRVDRAITTATTLGMMGKEVSEGSACMPEISIFAAGHRKVRKDATHIIK